MFICRRNTLPVSKDKSLAGHGIHFFQDKDRKQRKAMIVGTRAPRNKPRVNGVANPGVYHHYHGEVVLLPGLSLRDQFLILRWTQTLSLSVEPARRDTAFCCPHFQPLISGVSSPCT